MSPHQMDLRFFKAVVDHMSDAVLWRTPDGQVVYANDAACTMLGYRSDELLALNVSDLAPDGNEAMWRARWQRLLEERTLAVDMRYRCKDGRLLPVEGRVTLIEFEGEQYACVVARDVSARLATEEALRAHEADMLSLIETVDGFVWSIDRAYRLTAGNTAFRRTISESLGSELRVGDSVFSLTSEQDRRQWHSFYDRALLGESFSTDIQRIYGDNARWVRYRFNPVRDHDGAITGVTIIGRDITEERQAAQVIRDQLAEIALVYDTAPIGMAVLDTELRFQRVNRSLATINGVSPEEHVGRTVADVVPLLADMAQQIAAHILATGEPVTDIDIAGETPADPGVTHYWREHWYPCKDDDGTVVGFNVTAEDITERERERALLARVGQNLARAHEIGQMGSWEWDIATRAFDWSEGLYRLFGVDRDIELSTATIGDLLHPDDRKEVGIRIQEALAASYEVKFEFRIVRPDGAVRHMVAATEIWRDADGAPAKLFGIVQDITERKQAEEALRRSEHNLKEAERIGNSGSWSLDLATDTVFVSDNLYQLVGLDPERSQPEAGSGTIGLQLFFTEFLPPEDRDRVHQAFAAALDGAVPYDINHGIVRSDGVVRQVHTIAKVERNESGAPVRMLGHVEDITERKLAEAAVLERELRFRLLFENMRQGAVIERMDGTFVDINAAALTLFGLTREEFLSRDRGDSAWEIIEEDGSVAPPSQYPATVASQTGRPVYGTVYGIRNKATGKPVWVEIDAFPQVERGGSTPSLIMATLYDITERKLAAEELRRSEHNLNEAERLSNSGSFDYDVAAGRVTWSANMHALLDETEASLGESFIGKRVHPDDRQKVGAALAAALAAGGVTDAEFRIVRDDGRIRDIHVVSETQMNERGEATRTIGQIEDITERKQADAERERLHAQLAQAQKMESVGRLAGGIAHEFNNMLAVMMLRTEMSLGMVDTGSPLHYNLTSTYTTAQRSAKLVKQLLGYARKQVITPTVLDLNAAVEGMLPMLRKLIGEEVEVRWTPAAGLWPVKMDASQIDQIVTNLCVNGRDAIDGIGTISITTANSTLPAVGHDGTADVAAGDYVLMTVKDSGNGMTPEVIEHIFEPFYTTKEVGKGVGLGLATVDGIVHQNGGHIEVTSRPGAGTTFAIYLPRHVEAVEAPAASVQEASSLGKGQSVLLVEDDEAVLDMTAEVLRMVGYTVLTAPNPTEAIRVAAHHTGAIDLLLTDVIMPEMNGAELARHIRQERPAIAVLFMSGYPAEQVMKRCASAEVRHLLTKPFSVRELTTRVGQLLQAGSPDQATDGRAHGGHQLMED